MTDLVNRRISYKLYPNKEQQARLHELLVLHQRLYNAALEQRILCHEWRKRIEQYRDLTDKDNQFLRRGSTRFGQQQELTDLRREFPEYRAIPVVSARSTLQRLDEAFQHFFRRIREGKAGREIGYPRFKTVDLFRGFGFQEYKGWKFTPGDGWKHGRLYIKGVIGAIRCRGQARTVPEEIRTCDILHRDGEWHLSLVVRCRPERQHGTAAAGLDWGVTTLATIVADSGTVEEIENPKFLASMEKKLKHEQRALSRKRRGSANRHRQRKRYAKLVRRVADKRRDFEHQATKRIVDQYALISTEELDVKKMTTSAKGTAEKPGKGVKRKAGSNRRILDTSPDAFLQKLKYKVEESGGIWIDVPTQEVKPSQTCPACGHQARKHLHQRTHHCHECGHTEGRDVAAARVMLNWGLSQLDAAA